MLEGYFFYRALVTVFETSRVSRLAHHALGWGVPLLVVAVCLVTEAASSATVYTRPGACWLAPQAVPAIAAPAAIVLAVNIMVSNKCGARYSCFF